jgi:uncharacterized protein (DUF58 family)
VPKETPITIDPKALDWGRLSPLAFRAKDVTEGLYSGIHRSIRRGSGVEFGGHRDYVPGDDLRWLDHRAMMRHGKLLVRQFEMETERTLNLILDATPSMAFRSKTAPGAKLAYAALIAAAAARVALSGGDTVSLEWLGGANAAGLRPQGGKAVFERLVDALQRVEVSGDNLGEQAALSLSNIARRHRRGSVTVLFSDLLDLPEDVDELFFGLCGQGRLVFALRVLDPEERTFPFDGAVRLKSSESSRVVETDAGQVREEYLAALEQKRLHYHERLLGHGGQVIDCTTSDDPIAVLASLLRAAQRRSA